MKIELPKLLTSTHIMECLKIVLHSRNFFFLHNNEMSTAKGFQKLNTKTVRHDNMHFVYFILSKEFVGSAFSQIACWVFQNI